MILDGILNHALAEVWREPALRDILIGSWFKVEVAEIINSNGFFLY